MIIRDPQTGLVIRHLGTAIETIIGEKIYWILRNRAKDRVFPKEFNKITSMGNEIHDPIQFIITRFIIKDISNILKGICKKERTRSLQSERRI